MRKVDDGEKKNNGVFSGHYLIASSHPPTLVPIVVRARVSKRLHKDTLSYPAFIKF